MAVTHTLREFKTAYLQKAIRLDDVAVFSTEPGDIFKIGQVVNFIPKNGTTPAYIQKDASPAVGDYIIAQGDDTALPYGHVPVEDKNYKPKDYVAVTEDTAMSAHSITKSVVVYKITDLDDLISR